MKKKILVAAAALAVVGGSVGVLASDADAQTGSQEPRTVQTASYLSKDEALEKAFEHAEVARDEVEVEEVEFDKDDGVPHYEIEFEKQQTEYEYDIHAESGKILDYEIDEQESQEQRNKEKGEFITESEALETAIAHAAVTAESVKLEELELSKDDGHVYYEIEFESQNVEYEYDIDAVTADVWEYDVDDYDNHNDDAQNIDQEIKNKTNSKSAKQPASEQLTMEEARDIALAHAGVSLDTVSIDDAELDEDDGRLVWEFEFDSENLEIEAEIDAYSGAVIDFEKEHNN